MQGTILVFFKKKRLPPSGMEAVFRKIFHAVLEISEAGSILSADLFQNGKPKRRKVFRRNPAGVTKMKKCVVLFLCALTFGIFAQDVNLLKNADWRIYTPSDKVSVIDRQNGTFSFVGTADFKKGGAIQKVFLNQTEPKAITFSAESKCEDVKGNTANNYTIYLDLCHTDNSFTFGVKAAFKNGTHDWEKVQGSYTPSKPVKFINYYVLFRNVEGKAQVRNVILTQAK